MPGKIADSWEMCWMSLSGGSNRSWGPICRRQTDRRSSNTHRQHRLDSFRPLPLPATTLARASNDRPGCRVTFESPE